MEAVTLASPTPVPPIVLLVEDDADTRELYHAALEFEGYWVVGAPRWARRSSVRPRSFTVRVREVAACSAITTVNGASSR